VDGDGEIFCVSASAWERHIVNAGEARLGRVPYLSRYDVGISASVFHRLIEGDGSVFCESVARKRILLSSNAIIEAPDARADA
jgi:hypothetical protein